MVLGRKHNPPVIDDVGSGALIDFARFGLPGDPVVGESLATGRTSSCSAATAARRPAGWLIVGRKDLVQRIEKTY
jgi:L-seryl-tRNA(Ser) seleniumtransferase